MSAVVRDLLESPLALGYDLDAIPTYKTEDPARRILVFVRALGALVRWCRRGGRRVVHVHTAVRGSLYRKSVCVVVAKCMRRPVILHIHAGPGDIDAFGQRVGPLRRALFGLALRASDRVLSVSSAGARRMEAVFGARDVMVVPNAAPAVRPLESPGDRPDGGVRVLYLGGFENPAKGGAVLVRALPDLLASAPRATVTLAGPDEPPAELLDMDGMGKRVRWAGWLDERSKLEAFKDCDIFVLPSISEGLPVALLEAMSYGRAIVATEVGGVPDILTNDVDAILVPPADPPRLAEALAQLVESAPDRLRLAREARRRAERLNRDDVSGRIDDLYRELVS